MSYSKEQIINEIIRILKTEFDGPASVITAADQAFLGKSTNGWLESKLQQLQAEVLAKDHTAAQEKLARVQGERNADHILWRLKMDQAAEPERRAEAAKQKARDREVFAAVCHNHLVANIEANFSLLRNLLGIDFTEYSAAQAITSGAVRLAPARQAELNQWESERIEAHNETLLNLAERDPDQLRARVKQEAKEARVQQAQAESDRQIEAIRLKDEPFNYPALPSEFTKESLLQMVKNDTDKYRFLMTKFGNYNITARLQGRG
jgi:hypothetical protein